MKQPRALSVDDLWQLQRVGAPALAPDGRHAVCTVTRYDMQANNSATSLWLLPTERCAPKRLTYGGAKDGQPAWSPRGERIAFVGQREQEGSKDSSPQLYSIAAAGGEATRHSHFAPGVEAFKWLPDGTGVVFSAWVWPGLKGAAAQTRHHQQFSQRKESAYATDEAFYRHWDHNIPQGRVLHLLLLNLASGRVKDLFEGTALELVRDNAGNEAFDVSPDGLRLVFVHDPAKTQRSGNCQALAEMDLRTRQILWRVNPKDWDISAPRYSPDGARVAVLAAHVGRQHMAPSQLAVLESGRPWRPSAVRGEGWDYSINAPLRWSLDGQSLLFTAEEHGRCHLWRHSLADGHFDVAQHGGWVQGFDGAAGPSGEVLVTAADSLQHPVQIKALRGDGQALRLEAFNDVLLAQAQLGSTAEVMVTGALGEEVQMWLVYPPGFQASQRHAVMHVIHGGPHAAAGDTFSYRWNPHVLAARGFVVAQVNYHGSSGFGAAFKSSLTGRQGELELQDIEAASDWLLAQPWVDAQRLFATGGSYGGFLVAWMNGHVPGGPHRRYRAYVCHAGVFDRVATFSADSYTTRPKDLAANYWENLPHVLAQSPHAFAGQMDTPTLVIHGARDYRVPDCNGLAYYNTLKARGVAARLLWFPDENHWVLKPRNSKLWYAEFLNFLESIDE